MRISGFASGMDIDQMVSDLMKAERMPMNKLTQQKQLLEWKRDDYRDLNKLLTDFRNLSFDMTLQRTYLQKQVTSSNPKVTATASSSAANASYTISDVKAATVAYNSTSGFIKEGQKFDSSKPILEQQTVFGRFSESVASDSNIVTLSNSLEGSVPKKIKVTDADGIAKEYTVITTDAADIVGNQVYFDSNANQLTFQNNLTAGSKVEELSYVDIEPSFSITTYNQNGEPFEEKFTLDEKMTLDDIVSKINSSKMGLTAFYDNESNTIMFTKRDAGSFNKENGSEIVLKGNFLTDVLRFSEANEAGGEPAELKINGVATSRNSNNFTVNGVTFNLNGDMPGESAVISVNNDTDKTFESIKNYVEKYNELITKINEKTSQAVNRDYKPLTEEERESLSEKQIEQWEEKAKSGMLKNDSILTSGLSQLRTNFYEPLSGATGAFNQLAQIGISTSVNYRDGGKLIIDENKLREAIQKDSASIMELFTANGEGKSFQGLARRLRESVGTTIGQIEARAGNTLKTSQQYTIGRELLNVDKRISVFELRLQQKEERYWRQFTAMEKAINVSNNQSMQLMSQFYNNG